MTIRLLYHDPDSPAKVSPFDEAIVSIARGDNLRLACPYISLKYLCRVINLSASWRLLTDVEEWLRSQNQSQRKGVYRFLHRYRAVVKHCPLLHAKVAIGSRAAMLGSANFTDLGIRRRIEVSALFEEKPEVRELAEWFERQWKQAYDLPLDRIVTYMKNLPKEKVVEVTRKSVLFPVHLSNRSSLVPLSGTSRPGGKEVKNEEVYFNFGHDEGWREWEDARRYGFICAGGGRWFSAPLATLNLGSRVWVYAPHHGYVGVARVTGPAEPASGFKVKTLNGAVRPIMEVVESPDGYHSKDIKNPKRCEYFVPVNWLQTVPLEQAVWRSGLFANRTIVCRPTSQIWRTTLQRLKKEFPDYNKSL